MAIFLRANIYSRETMQHGKENLSGKVSNSWVTTLYVRVALSWKGETQENLSVENLDLRKLDSDKNLNSENLDDPITHGVASEVGNGMETEFAHEVGAMGFRGLDAEMKSDSDLLACLPFG